MEHKYKSQKTSYDKRTQDVAASQGQTPQCGEIIDQFFFYVLQSSAEKEREREIVHLQ